MTVDLSVSLGSQDGCGSIPKEAPLLASCPVPGQDGTLLRRAMASLAPPSPSVKKSESIAPHFLSAPGAAELRWQNWAGWHIWHRSVTQNRRRLTVASVGYHDAYLARGSQSSVVQALQPFCLQRAESLIGG